MVQWRGGPLFYKGPQFELARLPEGVHWMSLCVVMLWDWVSGLKNQPSYIMCIIRADIWMDTIFTDSQFRKFMDRQSAPCRVWYDPTTSRCPDECLYQLTNWATGPMQAQRILACLSARNRVIISYPLISTHSIHDVLSMGS